MTILEEIETLKAKLASSSDEKLHADLLLSILQNCVVINSKQIPEFAEHLLALSEKLAEPTYKAWALLYLSIFKRFEPDLDASQKFSEQSLTCFQELYNKKGISAVYNNMSRIFISKHNFAEAKKYAEIALEIGIETNNKEGMAWAHESLGLIHEFSDNYPNAERSYLKALELNTGSAFAYGMASNYSNLGNLYKLAGDYLRAVTNHLEALKILEQFGNKFGVASCHNNIGIIYSKQKNFKESLKHHEIALKIRTEVNDRHGMAGSYSNIANVYADMKDYPHSLEHYLKALSINEEINNVNWMAVNHHGIGTIYGEQGYNAKAKEHLNIALVLWQKVENKLGTANVYEILGRVSCSEGHFEEALAYAKHAMQIAEETGSKELKINSNFSLSGIYQLMGKHKEALDYFRKYHFLKEEMVGETVQKQVTELNFRHNLERKEKDLEIEQLRNVELKREKDRSESLLLNILPSEVAEELKEKGNADAKLFNDVTVFFSDFKSFTTISEKLTPQELVNELHECFSAFDEIMEKYSIEKIKTVGDAYLAVSGLPAANPNHAEDVVRAAVEIQRFMKERKKQNANREGLYDIRVGINSGSVVAGIVGVKKFAYDIWGDTVNTAARMEQNGEAGKVNISQATYDLVKDKFQAEYRGEIEAKNKGKLKMYFVECSSN
ncbi:MAG: tetratricopeptide repeat protein [Chitinophagales bacterium]|nr:tetratricopeptide repeat protein [Chitinophagales bacterium]